MARRKIKPTIPKATKAGYRALKEPFDPSPTPTEIDGLWQFFKTKCAFCGTKLVRQKGEAHLDHLIPDGECGSNTIRNRVLACAGCNSKGKRERPWEDLLKEKSPRQKWREARKKLISEWHSGGSTPVTISKELGEALDEKAKKFNECLQEAKRDLLTRFAGHRKRGSRGG